MLHTHTAQKDKVLAIIIQYHDNLYFVMVQVWFKGDVCHTRDVSRSIEWLKGTR